MAIVKDAAFSLLINLLFEVPDKCTLFCENVSYKQVVLDRQEQVRKAQYWIVGLKKAYTSICMKRLNNL